MENSSKSIGNYGINFSEDEQSLSAVLMTSYGIEHVILTQNKGIQSIIENFKKYDDSMWLNGLGKKALYEILHKRLKKEGAYFNKKTKKMNTNNKDWNNFCDDCVILASLGHVLYEYPIMLLHPQSYAENIKQNKAIWLNGANGKMPSLIDGIKVMTSQ